MGLKWGWSSIWIPIGLSYFISITLIMYLCVVQHTKFCRFKFLADMKPLCLVTVAGGACVDIIFSCWAMLVIQCEIGDYCGCLALLRYRILSVLECSTFYSTAFIRQSHFIITCQTYDSLVKYDALP